MPLSIQDFITRWKGSAGSEEANSQSFWKEFCEALELPAVDPKGFDDAYCFEKKIQLTHAEGRTSIGSADLYRHGCFVLEAKQGSTAANPGSTPMRGTASYERYMERAFGQAVNYAHSLPQRPPFVLTCDIGHALHVWDGFSGRYGGYGARRSIFMDDLLKADTQDFLHAIWMDPTSLDPARKRALVTREVATEIGKLAASLELRFPPKAVAAFLMRCVFTFFAEDASLLPERIFEDKLDAWRKNSKLFVNGLETLWDRMNTGGVVWDEHAVLRFNGGLFADHLALELDQREIEMLYQAARFNWSEVDPSIFGTLLESALSPGERHRLGAHYTPRAFIERLLKPALDEPLRADWDLAQAEAISLLGDAPNDADKAKARTVLHEFQRKLATTKVLDPACGSGNFLYVAYDLMKRIEREVVQRLSDLGETQRGLQLDTLTVTPAQFLGLEVKEWAAAIAELVLWIGHLQWFHREHPGTMPSEPVLQRYENIQNRDAVLTWSGTKETKRSRWDGKTFKVHPVTGKDVPDETAQTAIVEYLNPAPAPWPEADFIVGNPPFLGNKRMREALGDGYAEALRKTYPDVPESVDFVLYWWHRAAEAVRNGKTRRFGLITTNSLTQTFNRRVVAFSTSPSPSSWLKNKKEIISRDEGDKRDKKKPLKLLWAIPDHPWHDEGAAVRIAMTVGGVEGQPWLGCVAHEGAGTTPEIEAEMVIVEGRAVDRINSDLSAGADVSSVAALSANRKICFQGMILVGEGFRLTNMDLLRMGISSTNLPPVIRPHFNARDFMQGGSERFVIDLYGYSIDEARSKFPGSFQHVVDHVKAERETNQDKGFREKWWIFGRPRVDLRASATGQNRFIITPETSKHRVFGWADAASCPDHKLYVICSEDPFILGVLSSRFHSVWALAAGGTLENRPTWTNSTCFDPFPFPDAAEPQKVRIRDLAERLDAHRKGAQGRGVTITQMYNLREKLQRGEAFTDKERALHEAAQTSILAQLHDELDAAVLEAYGWSTDFKSLKSSTDSTDSTYSKTNAFKQSVESVDKPFCGISDADILTRLVALNRERAEEEKQGLIRWLRPEYQAPGPVAPIAANLGLEVEPEKLEAPLPEPAPWPKATREQLAAVRGVVLSAPRLWTAADVARCFKGRGRFRDSINAHLELLSDLGVITRLDTPEGPRYHKPVAMVAGG